MKIRQLSLFLENRPGQLRFLQGHPRRGIDILTMSLADTAQFGILRLVKDWHGAGGARGGRWW